MFSLKLYFLCVLPNEVWKSAFIDMGNQRPVEALQVSCGLTPVCDQGLLTSCVDKRIESDTSVYNHKKSQCDTFLVCSLVRLKSLHILSYRDWSKTCSDSLSQSPEMILTNCFLWAQTYAQLHKNLSFYSFFPVGEVHSQLIRTL